MTRANIKYEIKVCLENSACAGRSPGDYGDYVERLTEYLIKKVDEHVSHAVKESPTEE